MELVFSLVGNRTPNNLGLRLLPGSQPVRLTNLLYVESDRCKRRCDQAVNEQQRALPIRRTGQAQGVLPKGCPQEKVRVQGAGQHWTRGGA